MQHNQSDAPNPAVSNPGDAPAPEPSVYDRARVGNIQQLERFCKQYLEDIIARHGFPAKVQIHTPPGNGRHSTHDNRCGVECFGDYNFVPGVNF